MNALLNSTLKKIVTNPAQMAQVCEAVPDTPHDMGKARQVATGLMTSSQILHGFNGKVCEGLAANQMGINARIFVIRKKNRKYKAFINPAIIKSSRPVTSVEGCYSCPKIDVRVERYHDITVTAANLLTPLRLQGREAMTFQHELDHLNGKLITDLPENCRVTYGEDSEM